ncbi:MAG: B12-binding domain-containing radical SAM protein [Bacteroidetes bacterium]|nr:B12-binding domain-containing radical SAM protein [Bacteroidota bacterium]
MIDVLFIIPPIPLPLSTIFLRPVSEASPLGIGYMDSVLSENGFKTAVKNYYLGISNMEELTNTLIDLNPRIIAITSMTETFNNAAKVAEICKKTLPKSNIIIGGPHVSFLDEITLKEHKYIDFIVRNEGEVTLLELTNHLLNNKSLLSNIKGITYRNGEEVVRNGSRSLIKNLDELPFPKRYFNESDFVEPSKKIIGVISSRGCPGQCIFCSASALAGGVYRKRSPENLISEVEYYVNKGHNYFFFMDDTITADIDRFARICDMLKKYNITWSCESRVDVIAGNKGISSLMYDSGCRSIQFGVETGSHEILESINKGIELEQVEKAVQYARDSDIEVVCSMIIGHYNDNVETVRQTINYAEYLMKKYIIAAAFSMLTPYPGTKIYNNSEDFGIKVLSNNYDHFYVLNPNIETKYLTKYQLRNLFYEAMMCATKNMPKKWMNYYSTEIEKSLQYLRECSN